jgi:hypothetical protein
MRGIEDRSKSNFTHSVVLRLHPLDLAEINEADSFGDERWFWVLVDRRVERGGVSRKDMLNSFCPSLNLRSD